MWRRYLIAAIPAILMIAVAWLTPLIFVGRFEDTLSFDGGGRVLDENGVCCVEPTYFFVARVAATLSPIAIIACLLAIAVIRARSKRS